MLSLRILMTDLLTIAKEKFFQKADEDNGKINVFVKHIATIFTGKIYIIFYYYIILLYIKYIISLFKCFILLMGLYIESVHWI